MLFIRRGALGAPRCQCRCCCSGLCPLEPAPDLSGGILNGSLNNNALGLSADAPVSLSGALQAATGTVDAATGLNLQGVSGLVSGL